MLFILLMDKKEINKKKQWKAPQIKDLDGADTESGVFMVPNEAMFTTMNTNFTFYSAGVTS
ncbi:MAG: hypothetical protein ACJAWV_001632 [Flammeovirgaceae bacterium]|jgi:hypothetical protein